MNIQEIIKLSDLLGELGQVMRATRLPNDEPESDSHHSFMLAMVGYDICQKYCPELDASKVVLYALAHDLLEIVTGDEDTLHYNAEELHAKHLREKEAAAEFDRLFADYPALKDAMYEYERLDNPESATVFVLDKACTTWTHMHDQAKFARNERNLTTKQSIEDWAERQRQKITKRLKAQPPQVIYDIYEASFETLKGLYSK